MKAFLPDAGCPVSVPGQPKVKVVVGVLEEIELRTVVAVITAFAGQ